MALKIMNRLNEKSSDYRRRLADFIAGRKIEPFEEEMNLWSGSVYQDVFKDGKWHHVCIGKNKVLLGGLMLLCNWLYNQEDFVQIKRFEDSLYESPYSVEDLRPSITPDPDNVKDKRYIMGYNVSYDGEQGDGTRVVYRHKLGYDFDSMIPFRCIPEENNDYSIMKTKYLHHMIRVFNGHRYVCYYTKKVNMKYTLNVDNGTTVPNYPETNLDLPKDKDTRANAGFTVQIDTDEFIEYFSITKAGGAESAYYNSITTMNGKPAKIRINEEEYDTMTDTLAFSKCNHKTIAHGVEGNSTTQYQIMHK